MLELLIGGRNRQDYLQVCYLVRENLQSYMELSVRYKGGLSRCSQLGVVTLGSFDLTSLQPELKTVPLG